MTKLKIRRLKQKNIKVRESILHFFLYFIYLNKLVWIKISFIDRLYEVYIYRFLLETLVLYKFKC